MVDIVDTPSSWVPVDRVEITDIALGGNEVNVPNKQYKSLAQRDRFLYDQIISLQGGTAAIAISSFDTFKRFGMAAINQGRLTAQTANPLPNTDVLAATSVFFTPFDGDRVSLWNAADNRWDIYQFTERSLSLAGLAANTNYDIFLFDNAGTLTLQSVAWSNSGAGTSTRAQAISLRDGQWVRTSDNRRYLGTIRTTATIGQTEDSEDKRFVWNVSNQQIRRVKQSQLANYTYNSTTIRPANNNTALRIQIVNGLSRNLLQMSAKIDLSGGDINPLLGVNSTTVTTATDIGYTSPVNVSGGHVTASFWIHGLVPQLGFSFYQLLEAMDANGGITSASVFNPTIQGFWQC